MSDLRLRNMGKRWTAAEDAALEELWGTVPVEQLAVRFGRTERTVKNHAARLGIRHTMKWTPEAEARLEELYAETPAAEIAAEFGCPVRAVYVKANSMGLQSGTKRRWSRREERLLEELYPTTPVTEIGRRLGRTRWQVGNKARRLGLWRGDPLSDDARELLEELADEPGVAEYFARHFDLPEPVIRRELDRIRA